MTITDKPRIGMIIRVEQRSWSALTRTWDKTVVVGFGTQEILINPCTTTTEVNKSKLSMSPRVLLPVSETLALARMMRHLRTIAGNRDAGKLLLTKAS